LMDSAATQVGLAWADNNNATNYTIRYRPHNATVWQIATSSTNSLTISDLLPCTFYETNVKAICDTTESVWSATLVFKTLGCINGVNSFKLEEKIVLFPNPVDDFLNVKSEGFIPEKYEIVNILGEKVKNGVLIDEKTEFQIELKELVAGSYFLILENRKGESVVMKFVR
jgi:hypothetical protein